MPPSKTPPKLACGWRAIAGRGTQPAGASGADCDARNSGCALPDWHSGLGTVLVKHFVYSERDLKHFYVYPPNTGTGTMELVYSASPLDAKYPPDPPPPIPPLPHAQRLGNRRLFLRGGHTRAGASCPEVSVETLCCQYG